MTKMMQIGIFILIIFIIVYLYKNRLKIWKKLEEFSNLEWKSKVNILGSIFIIFLMILGIGKYGVKIIKDYKKNSEYMHMYDLSDQKIAEEIDYYNSMMKKEYTSQNYENPYIPDGFSYVEGTYEDGFVIQDENENQYVWVPCTNRDIEGVIKLQKKDFVNNAFISKELCYDESYKDFIKSVLENGGFYISRYEIGKENENLVSKKGAEVCRKLNRQQAIDLVETMEKKDNIHYELMNGYAYDTTLEWIKSKQNIEYDIVEDLEKIYSGRKEYQHIYDFIDNVLEITLETTYDNVIIRGFSSVDSDDYNDWGNKFCDENRYSILKEDTIMGSTDVIAFRTILYQ